MDSARRPRAQAPAYKKKDNSATDPDSGAARTRIFTFVTTNPDKRTVDRHDQAVMSSKRTGGKGKPPPSGGGEPMAQTAAKQKRSRNGCRECRRLHRKCDEETPSCRHCRENGRECDYSKIFVWGGRPQGPNNPFGQLVGAGVQKFSSRPGSSMRRFSSSLREESLLRAAQAGPAPDPFVYVGAQQAMTPSSAAATAGGAQQAAKRQSLTPKPTEILRDLPRSGLPDRSQRLVEYFIERMGPALSLTQEMHEDLCSVVLPMALGTTSYLLSAVLCLSSTHRAVLGLDRDQTEHVAWRHECIIQMQSAVIDSNGDSEDVFIAAALLICYSDIIEGGERQMTWSTHLRGALAKVDHTNSTDEIPQQQQQQQQQPSTVTPARRHLCLRLHSLQALAHMCTWQIELQPVNTAATDAGRGGMALSQLHGFATHLVPIMQEAHLAVVEKHSLKELDRAFLASNVALGRMWHCLQLRASRLLAQVDALLDLTRRQAASGLTLQYFETTFGIEQVAGASEMSAQQVNEWLCINTAYHHACTIFIHCELQGLLSSDERVEQAVARAMDCLRQLEVRPEPCPAAAMLLPVFITGCQSLRDADRAFIVEALTRLHKLYGKVNAANASEFLQELWARRDGQAQPQHVVVADLMGK